MRSCLCSMQEFFLTKSRTSKKGKSSNLKFCHKDRRNRCEQQWNEHCVSAEGVAKRRIKAHAKVCNYLKIDPLIDLESEEHYYKGSERTNASKDEKTDKRKTSSELK